ncbi:hypothetical protein CEXT_643271 [Caerostris extrusa]|uniref:Uncharacterized protein n=1 Tax=Caerostris extrusa TaxID=172846 RepID=A0AAV4SZM6_CAEEX|nr:hypothetical protein CEXT_643271 [Caerostris extrusa]
MIATLVLIFYSIICNTMYFFNDIPSVNLFTKRVFYLASYTCCGERQGTALFNGSRLPPSCVFRPFLFDLGVREIDLADEMKRHRSAFRRFYYTLSLSGPGRR